MGGDSWGIRTSGWANQTLVSRIVLMSNGPLVLRII